MEISGHTGLAGIIGSPVSHSISPKMHNMAFKALGIDCVYLAFDIGGRELKKAVEGLREIGAIGFNVTMPYKESVVGLMDGLTPAARLCGAVNTVICKDGKMTGHTTDGEGFMLSVADCGYDIIGKKISILGAGGAAKSIIAQAAIDGVAAIDIFRRKNSPAYAETLEFARRIQNHTVCKITVCDFADEAQMQKSFAESAVLANATSLGMAPREDTCPIADPALLPPGLFVYDIVYNPRQTRLMQMAEERGCPTQNGLSMILFQGAASFKCWTGREMPVELVRDAVFAA